MQPLVMVKIICTRYQKTGKKEIRLTGINTFKYYCPYFKPDNFISLWEKLVFPKSRDISYFNISSQAMAHLVNANSRKPRCNFGDCFGTDNAWPGRSGIVGNACQQVFN